MNDTLNLFCMFSDKTRLRILLLLLNSELCVCEIYEMLNMSQPRVSRQLSILKQAKLIKERRKGRWIYYTINHAAYYGHLTKLLEQLPDWLKDDEIYNNDKAKLYKLYESKNGS